MRVLNFMPGSVRKHMFYVEYVPYKMAAFKSNKWKQMLGVPITQRKQIKITLISHLCRIFFRKKMFNNNKRFISRTHI